MLPEVFDSLWINADPPLRMKAEAAVFVPCLAEIMTACTMMPVQARTQTTGWVTSACRCGGAALLLRALGLIGAPRRSDPLRFSVSTAEPSESAAEKNLTISPTIVYSSMSTFSFLVTCVFLQFIIKRWRPSARRGFSWWNSSVPLTCRRSWPVFWLLLSLPSANH